MIRKIRQNSKLAIAVAQSFRHGERSPSGYDCADDSDYRAEICSNPQATVINLFETQISGVCVRESLTLVSDGTAQYQCETDCSGSPFYELGNLVFGDVLGQSKDVKASRFTIAIDQDTLTHLYHKWNEANNKFMPEEISCRSLEDEGIQDIADQILVIHAKLKGIPGINV